MERRITAIHPGVSHPDRERSAKHSGEGVHFLTEDGGGADAAVGGVDLPRRCFHVE